MEELGFPHKTLERAVTQPHKAIRRLPHINLDNEKTDAGTCGEPPTAKTGKIYLDPSPKVLGKI